MSDTSLDDYYWQYLLSEGLELDRLYGGGHQLSSSTAVLSDNGYDDSSPLSAGDNSPAAAVSGRNDDVRERRRGRTLNDKLYALRSVVPNITKMDKASVIKDAIDHIQQLQKEERRMLAEVSVLESAALTHCRLLGTAASGAIAAALLPDGCGDDSQTAVPPTKKVRRAQSFSSSTATPASSAAAAYSPPVEALEVRVTATEDDKTLLVSVACRHRRDAIAVVCRALECLGLPVVAATVTSASGTVMHTALVKREEIHESEMKEMIETAIAHLDVIRSP